MTVLHLPLPPSRNRSEGKTAKATHFMKRAYQRKAWVAAIQQVKPMMDPPALVRVSAHFKLYGPLRDEMDGNDVKWVLDTLRQRQSGSLKWRQGVYSQAGYFVDDDPSHLKAGTVTQEIDRKNRKLIVTIQEV